MIIVHPWKSHRVLLQLGFPNVFCLSPNSSTKNGGGYGFCTHPCWVWQPSSIKKSTVFIRGRSCLFSPRKKNCANFIGSFRCPNNGIHLSQKLDVKRKECVLVHGWNCPICFGERSTCLAQNLPTLYARKRPRFIGRKCIFSTSRRWRPYPWQEGKKWDEQCYVVVVVVLAPLNKIIKSIQAESKNWMMLFLGHFPSSRVKITSFKNLSNFWSFTEL